MIETSTRPAAPRDNAQPGDILLFAGARGPMNRVISWFSRSPYFHAAIYAGNDEIIEEQPKGVTRRTLDTSYGSHCIAVLPAPGGRDCGLKALAWAETQIGDPFDRLDFLVIALQHIFTHWHINYAPPNRYTCAEFVATAWQKADGITLVPGVELSDIEPADLAKLLPPGTKPRTWFWGGECR